MSDKAVYSEALKILEHLLKDKNLEGQQRDLIRKLCGVGYYFLGNHNEALRYLESVELEDFELYFYRASVRQRFEKLSDSEKDYNKAIELAPDVSSRAAALAGHGAVLARMGQYDKALEDYNEALKLVADAPSRAAALAGHGAVLARMEQYDKALGDLNEAIKLAEDIANKATSPAEHGAALNAAVQLDFDRSKMYIWRGLTYMSKKQCIKALKDFDRAIELDPADAQALYCRGLAHLEMRSYVKAENDFNVVSRLEPRYAAPLAALAELHLRIALETLERAFYLCQVNPQIHQQYLVNEIRRRIDALRSLL